MSQYYRNQGKSSPFSYGSTEAVGLPQSDQSCDSFQGGSTGSSNYPRMGEGHPEGPQTKRLTSATGSENDLNFGWFTVPGTREGCPADSSGASNAGNPMENQPPNQGGTFNQKPPSRTGSRPDSNPPQGSPYPSFRADSKHDSQSQGQYPPPDIMEVQSAQGAAPEYQVASGHQVLPVPREGTPGVMDWPLSQAALEQMAKYQPAPQQTLYEQPAAQRLSHTENQVPPTPIPPIQWEVYGNQPRPTYSSWHEEWHRRNGRPRSFDANFNNSLATNTNNNNNNSSNNNNDNSSNDGDSESDQDDSALDGKSGRPTDQNHLVQAVVSADGNNNNWTKPSCGSPRSRQGLATLPLYDLTHLAPAFYSPSVVMKWEDTDEHIPATPSKDSNGHRSFISRLRSGIFNLLSSFSCLNIAMNSPGGHSVKLFKYNRFDAKDKSK